MTLGGLALAIGILVDDSTVTIENTHRLLTEEHQPLPLATLHGAAGIAVPTLVSTLAICAVFTSVVFLDGPAKFLFTPLGLAVVFAMLASYLLSRTLTPITIGLLLRHEKHEAGPPKNLFQRLSAGFERGFEEMRESYVQLLQSLLARRLVIPVAIALILGLTATMYMMVGRDFFPTIDGGQIQLHVRGPAGLRIEATEALFQQVEDKIRDVVPPDERERIVDNIGLPARTYNLAFADGSTTGANDGVIIVALKDGHAPTQSYIDRLRLELRKSFPQATFYFQAADMVTQILNFGLPAQIDIRTVGYDRANNLRVARDIQRRLAAEPGFADAHLQQEVDAPAFMATIDRDRALELGLSTSAIASNLNIALSSSEQVSPNFWTDPKSGIPYFFAVQAPESRIASLNDLQNIPVSATLASVNGAPTPGLLSNVATLKRDSVPTNANQSNIQPVYEVFASLQATDLGTASRKLDKIVEDLSPQLKPGNRIQVSGQIESMRDSFRNLGLGLLFAAVLVYFLMVVNYQNFGDPLVVILALPATFCGILTMLFITGSTLSVPSLMGAIMAVGVASANSILLVTFARERQLDGASSFEAAVQAGHTRIRPVLMTAAAMIVGMIPMAIGGAGEEQNAVLARAVIGGLLFATPTTLLIVPYLFAVLRRGNDGKSSHGVFEETEMEEAKKG
jgi:multidrug efflux pump subunit AcrB